MAFGPLVSADWLHEHLTDHDVRVIDFRWYLRGKRGRDEYLKGHIPGAVFVDLESVTGKGPGRHPLPTREQFESAMQEAGVSSQTKVIAYDDEGDSVASRLWFLLRYFGHPHEAVLDGGLQAWGSQLETEVPHVARGDFRAGQPDRSKVLDVETVSNLHGVPLIDARAPERYRGETEPVDPKAGHIPGALNAPFRGNLGPDGRFKSPSELRERFAKLGAEKGAVFYCGSGVNATHEVLAMEIAGLPNARIYEGSWSDWSRRDLPVATGPEPG